MSGSLTPRAPRPVRPVDEGEAQVVTDHGADPEEAGHARPVTLVPGLSDTTSGRVAKEPGSPDAPVPPAPDQQVLETILAVVG